MSPSQQPSFGTRSARDAARAAEDRADARAERADERAAAADHDGAEYRRALYHYTQLMRHRMANPLQTICGMSDTLARMPDLPRDQRIEMATAIHEQAKVLEQVCMDPVIDSPSEAGIRPRPFDE